MEYIHPAMVDSVYTSRGMGGSGYTGSGGSGSYY